MVGLCEFTWAKIRWIVLTRDDFTCQECGERRRFFLVPWGREHAKGEVCDLEVHHIDGIASCDPNNLISL